MKSKTIFMLSAVLALSLCACKGNNNGGKTSEQQKQTPDVNPTMELKFDDLTEEDTACVPSYVKEYIDAMKEQEARITYPDRVDSLFCEMTWEQAAALGDKGDNATYSSSQKGGVDVCEMLSRSQSYENKPVELKWEKGDKDFSEAKVVFWTKVDKSDKREAAVDASGEKAVAKLENLMINTAYYYQVVNGEEASQMCDFVTGDYSRMITMGKISNVRDIGGHTTSYGVTTNQGLIFRGGEITPKAFNEGGSHGANWTGKDAEAGQKVQEEVMKIGLELDLRTKSGSNNSTKSELNWDGEWQQENKNPNLQQVTELGNTDGKAQYVRCAINSYDSFITDQNRKSESENADRDVVGEIFNYFSNADKQHVFFHCWGGADRTGVTGFLLNAICGVSYTDSIIDFELTTLTNNKRCHMHNSTNAHFPKFLKIFTSEYEFERNGEKFQYTFDAEKTLRQNADNLLVAMGVKLETLEKIRGIMLPGYAEGKLTENERVNKGWQAQLATFKKQASPRGLPFSLYVLHLCI